jgi:uncharacterized protein YjbI with pentapeptide repeats
MPNAGTGRVIQFGGLVVLMAVQLTSQAQNNLQWKDSSGKTRNRSDLNKILTEHKVWDDLGEFGRKFGTQADLSGAELQNADLSGAYLNSAKLDHAWLGGAKLSHATLFHAMLDHADLTDATLDHADLRDAEMTGAHLAHANLDHASLVGANLAGAALPSADLSGADLRNANLIGASVIGAKLDGALFEPNSLPELHQIAAAQNLELLTYYTNPDALAQLRKQFEDGGFREQERKITYAIKRREAELSGIIWSGFNKVLFDWTCQYGMSPGRPLFFGAVLWFLCTLIYFAFIGAGGRSALYRIPGQRIDEDPPAPRRPERISRESTWQSRLRKSMFFSLMCAFNIGFRDINFGRWLRLLPREEFDIKAEGWARTVAGWQSLISVYLVALWVLTYFGRPFG